MTFFSYLTQFTKLPSKVYIFLKNNLLVKFTGDAVFVAKKVTFTKYALSRREAGEYLRF